MYVLSGQKWGAATNGTNSGPVYWSSDFIDSLDFDRERWTEADFNTSLQSAFQAWEDVAGIDFEMADEANSADIMIGTQSLPGPTVGLATYTYLPQDGVDQFTSAKIVFDEDETWSPDGGGATQNFAAIALHEIGHTIGLDHVDDDSEILNRVVRADELGDGDIAGAQAIYGPSATPSSSDADDTVNTAFDAAENGDEQAAAYGGGSDGATGMLALLGLGVVVLVGGAGGLIAGGAMAALGVLSGGGSGDSSAAEGNASSAAITPDASDFIDGLPLVEFSSDGMGCPTCGDSACFGCGEQEEDDATDVLV